jgi:hypothetical protein
MTIAGLDCVSNGPDDFIIVSLLFVEWKNAIDREKKKRASSSCEQHSTAGEYKIREKGIGMNVGVKPSRKQQF